MNWWLIGFMACLAVLVFTASWLGALHGTREALKHPIHTEAGTVEDDAAEPEETHAGHTVPGGRHRAPDTGDEQDGNGARHARSI